jgi:Ca-activated chloride channel family protein
MAPLMRCQFCGILQDEPVGAKICALCGGELQFESPPPPDERDSYLQAHMELDQVMAPAGQNCERYLLVTLTAPAQIPAAQAVKTAGNRSPIQVALVLDNSGSMQGAKLTQAKEAVRQALHRLLDGDVLSLVLFSSEVHCLLEPTPLNQAVRKQVVSLLDEINATSMTALCGGLEMGIQKSMLKKQDTNLVLLLSDGLANVGETDLEKIATRATQARQKGVTVSTLGVGLDYNEALLAEIATQGGGRYYHVEQAGQINAYLNGELGEMANLAGRSVALNLVVPDGVVVMALSAAYPIQQGGGEVSVDVGDLPCDTELEIPLRVVLSSQVVGARLRFEGWVGYSSPAGNSLKTTLNRVTLRFVDQPAFQLRDGAVKPVIERVMQHVKATGILGVSYAMTKGDAESQRRVEEEMRRMRDYAKLLGEDAAVSAVKELESEFLGMRSTPSAAKFAVSDAYFTIRKSKKFSK